MRPSATVSVDIDPIDIHLVGYGHRGAEPDESVYARGLPRIVGALAGTGVRATFFIVARDAGPQSDRLKSLVAGGHEVASHSMTHPAPFERLGGARISHELAESRRRLESAVGAGVVGFRAPNWDIGPRLHGALVEAGYMYDASAFPSPFLLPARALLAVKSRDPHAALSMRRWPFTWSRLPYRWRVEGRALRQFPISVTPRLRLPLYHTSRYFMSERRFLEHLDGFARRGEPFFYPLHAVDAMGMREDGVDPRLARHPGMDRPLETKLALLDHALRAIADRFEPVTYAAYPNDPLEAT